MVKCRSFCSTGKLHQLQVPGLINTRRCLPIVHLSGKRVTTDTLAANGLPSVAQYIRKIFLISDNDAYNRLYEFTGQQTLNEKLWQKGYKDSRITRRFVTMTEEQNRHTNPTRFMQGIKQYTVSQLHIVLCHSISSKKILVGNAHYNRGSS